MLFSLRSRLNEKPFRSLRGLNPLYILGPVLLGAVMGFLVSRGDWHFALAVAAMPVLAVVFTAQPFAGVILWLLLTPLSSAFPNPPLMYWVFNRILIPITLFLTLIPRLFKRDDKGAFRPVLPDLCIMLLAMAIPFSIIFLSADSRVAFIKYADRFLIPFCMYLIARLTIFNARNLKALEITAFIVASFQCVIGFLSWVMPQILPSAWHHLIGARTAGSLLDPAVFTSLLVFCAMLLFHAAVHMEHGLTRTLYLVVFGACFISVFISLERGSWLAGTLVLLGLFALYPKRALRFLVIIAVLVTLLGSVFLSRQISMVGRRFADQRPVDDRIVVADAMLRMAMEKPVFGWGYDTLDRNLRQYYRALGWATVPTGYVTSHNTFLTILTELGLVGFVLYLLPLYWLLRKSFRVFWRSAKARSDRVLLIFAFWLAALQYFVVSNFMDMRFFPIGLTLWWMELGIIASLLEREETGAAVQSA